MPIPTTVARRIPATGKTELRLIQKAGSKAQVAVYGADGALLGVCDADAIQQLADPPGTPATQSQATTDANAAKVQQAHAQQEVAKAVAPILAKMTPRPAGQIRKAATTLGDQWKALLAAAGPQAPAIQALTASEAMKLMIRGGADGTKAVNIAKRAAVTAALNKNVI